MKNTIALTINRMQLAMRNRIFLVFSLIMPLIFFFLFLGLFARTSRAALLPAFGQVIGLTVMGNFWGLSVQLVTFREQGILRRFRLAPIGAASMLISSIIANYILTLPTLIIEFFLAIIVFHMHSFGNLFGVFILATLGVISFASLGLIIASVTNTMQETQIINQIIWLGFLFLSGATLPLAMLPNFIQTTALFLPATYLVNGLQRTLAQSVDLSALFPAVLSLIGTTLIAFTLSVKLFRWDQSEKATRTAKIWAASAIIPFLLLGAYEAWHGQLKNDARSVYSYMDRESPQRESPR